MVNKVIPNREVQIITEQKNNEVQNHSTTKRVAFTPIEFASLFGREKTFTYRLLYKGKIKCIKPGNGRILIPANEVQKLIGEAKAYS